MLLEIFVNGAWDNHEGIGGWAYLITHSTGDKTEVIRKVSGRETDTTSNRMQLTAIKNAMEYIIESEKKDNERYKVKMYSSSAYCINAFNRRWIKSWIVNDWTTSQGREVANKELWNDINELDKKLDICFIKTKDESGNPYM